MAKTSILALARLRELISYNPKTGEFKWRSIERPPWRERAGSVRHERKTGRKRYVITIDGHHYDAGILAWLWMKEKWPPLPVEHVDGNSLNYRWSNLCLRKGRKYRPLTAKRLHEVLDYDPNTGKFYNNEYRRGQKRKVGCVAKHKSNSYIIIGIDYGRYRGHVLAWLWMTGKWPTEEVDHINRIGTDNRWSNLRSATPMQNNWNMPLLKTNTTGHTGVYWNKRDKKWQAFFSISFREKSDAITARNKIVSFMRGDFLGTTANSASVRILKEHRHDH